MPGLCSRYNWPAGTAPGGGVIAIYQFRKGWQAADMTAYFASIGQPVPSITDVSVDGVTNNDGTAGPEQTIDIQAAASSYYVATGSAATIRVYWDGTHSGPDYAIAAAVADGCDVFTTSLGFAEYFAAPTLMDQVEAAALAATQAGMVCIVASGDDDSGDQTWTTFGRPGVTSLDFPSCCPHFVAVGGTTLDSGNETAWNNSPGHRDGVGTGGGFSSHFAMPAWQIGRAPAPPTGLGKMVPDLAMNAGPNNVQYYVGGSAGTTGGTSITAPLFAGLVASCGRKLGFIAPKMWSNPSLFNDITSGDNGDYSALTGPDACTGLGSPKGAPLAAVLQTMGPFLLEGGGDFLLEGGGNLQLEGV